MSPTSFRMNPIEPIPFSSPSFLTYAFFLGGTRCESEIERGGDKKNLKKLSLGRSKAVGVSPLEVGEPPSAAGQRSTIAELFLINFRLVFNDNCFLLLSSFDLLKLGPVRHGQKGADNVTWDPEATMN
ncbi:hypothetical protein ZIOFF_043840 [Zingiber officinale]|uniref:Uncharacterized protein n=1 Tax=Zingiber officinale TaxID=94328 RepID=A0A8J5FVP3_ZINOF|nr:hypothetical protein ZIOFF_043840 [Zingiber officinale]